MSVKHVLVVDPNPAAGEMLTSILTTDGYEVVLAQSLEEGILLLQRSRFDLIITEALEQHRGVAFNPAFLGEIRWAGGKTPVILFSTYVSTDGIPCGRFGLAEVVTKPFEMDEFLAKVTKLTNTDH